MFGQIRLSYQKSRYAIMVYNFKYQFYEFLFDHLFYRYRDGSRLCQKLLHTRCDDDGLFYSSTQIFSCWEKERADEYVELDAEIVTKKNINFVAKILDIDTVEALCSNGNFKELGLEPYTPFEMRAAQNVETDLPKLIPSDSSSEDLYKTPDDSISSDD